MTRSTAAAAEELYRKHILRRTGGVEPPDPFDPTPVPDSKSSVDDYVRTAKEVLGSLQRDGFRPDAVITYYKDGTLGNGAHRVAAALALDLPVLARRHEGPGRRGASSGSSRTASRRRNCNGCCMPTSA